MTVDTALVKLVQFLPSFSIPFNFSVFDTFANFKIITFSKLAKVSDTPIDKVVYYLNSQNAVLSYNSSKNQWCVFYNDTNIDFIKSNRYRFSIAHEIGHLFLGHLNNNSPMDLQQHLSDQQYKAMERQADKFSAKLLCPFISFKMYNINSPQDISNIYKVSMQSANIMYENYQKWLYKRKISHIRELKYQDIIKDKFDFCVYNKLNIKYNRIYG